MKRYAVVAIAISLAGCNTLSADHSGLIDQVQQGAKAACKFIPTAKTILDIFAKGNPAISTADAIATAICGAVTGPGKAAPVVAGVAVEGSFVTQ